MVRSLRQAAHAARASRPIPERERAQRRRRERPGVGLRRARRRRQRARTGRAGRVGLSQSAGHGSALRARSQCLRVGARPHAGGRRHPPTGRAAHEGEVAQRPKGNRESHRRGGGTNGRSTRRGRRDDRADLWHGRGGRAPRIAWRCDGRVDCRRDERRRAALAQTGRQGAVVSAGNRERKLRG